MSKQALNTQQTEKPIFLSESFVNATKGVRYGESGIYEAFTSNVGRLFRSLQREYGRCTSRVYVDTDTGTETVGWVFEKRVRYDDARGNHPERDYYLREVWVTLHERMPETGTTTFPYYL